MYKKIFSLITCIAVLATLMMPFRFVSSAEADLILDAEADAYIGYGAANHSTDSRGRNYGGLDILSVRHEYQGTAPNETPHYATKSYIRFSNEDGFANVAGAALKLNVVTAPGTNYVIQVYGLLGEDNGAHAWVEGSGAGGAADTEGITWSNAPGHDKDGLGVILSEVYGGAALDTKTGLTSGGTVSFDVSNYVKSLNGTKATFILLSNTKGSACSFASMEHEQLDGPKLSLTYQDDSVDSVQVDNIPSKIDIPEANDAAAIIQPTAEVFDANGTSMATPVNWLLPTPYFGVSIDKNTGEILVSNTASAGMVTVRGYAAINDSIYQEVTIELKEPEITQVPGQRSVTFITNSDATVSHGSRENAELADINYGWETQLSVRTGELRGPHYSSKSYIAFSYPGLAEAESAKLYFTAQSEINTAIEVYGLRDGAGKIDESFLTWNNAPANDVIGSGVVEEETTLLDTVRVDTEKIYAIDVTEYIKTLDGGNATFILVAKESKSAATMFYSKEGAAAAGNSKIAPKLVLSLSEETIGVINAVEITEAPTGITLPEEGGTAIIRILEAVVKNNNDQVMVTETVTWSLASPYAGVGIDPLKGELTIEPTAAPGIITVRATSATAADVYTEITIALEEYVDTKDPNSISLLASADNTIKHGDRTAKPYIDTNFGTELVLTASTRQMNSNHYGQKIYMKFSLFAMEHIEEAELEFTSVAAASTIRIYGLSATEEEHDWQEYELTWNNAPGNDIIGSEVLLNKVYTSAPLVQMKNTEGVHKIDVTNYIKSLTSNHATFIITVDYVASGTEQILSKEGAERDTEGRRGPTLHLKGAYSQDSANLALGSTVIASSAHSTHEANRAVDGGYFTRWESAGDSMPAWLSFDLGIEKTFSQVVFYNHGDRIFDYTIQYSSDNETWTDVYEGIRKGASTGLTSKIECYLDDPVTARYVRLLINNANGRPSVYEFKIYNAPPITDARLTSTVYQINDAESTILVLTDAEGIDSVDINTFKQNITRPVGGFYTVYQENGTTEASNAVKDGYKVVAVANDKVTVKTYTVIMITNTALPVPPIDFTVINPSMFTDEEIEARLPYYLVHFHTVANSILLEGEYKGFLDNPVNRNPEDNEPYNARIMENHISLAYFLSTDREWNPYYNSPYVRYRLELMLDYLMSIQREDGAWPEYSWEDYQLAPTAFGATALASTLQVLDIAREKNSGFIMPSNFEQAKEACLAAITKTLTDNRYIATANTNQFEAVYPGALIYLGRFHNPELEALLKNRMEEGASLFYSPAGFPYEANSVDYTYNLSTRNPIFSSAWNYSRLNADSFYKNLLIKDDEKFYDWLKYTSVIEPDGSFIVFNMGLSGRTAYSRHQARLENPIAEELPIARAFASTDEEHKEKVKKQKEELWRNWPDVGKMVPGETQVYNGRTLYRNISEYSYYPTEVEREAARQQLPYIASNYFNHQRVDNKNPLEVTAIRRPGYYTIFNSGLRARPTQQFGLGLIWHPEGGIMMQSQHKWRINYHVNPLTRDQDLSWGTKEYHPWKHYEQLYVYESNTIDSSYSLNGSSFIPSYGAEDLPNGDLQIKYNLGSGNNAKTLLFTDEKINVSIEHSGKFSELLPLTIRKEDVIEYRPGYFKLTRGRAVMEIIFDSGTEPRLEARNHSFHIYDVYMLNLDATDRLNYSIKLSTVEPNVMDSGQNLLNESLLDQLNNYLREN